MVAQSRLLPFREMLLAWCGVMVKSVKRHIMVLPALGACGAVLLVGGGTWWLWLAFGLLACMSWLGGVRSFVLTLLCSLLSGYIYDLRNTSEYATAQLIGEAVECRVTVVDEVRLGRDGWEVMVNMREGGSSGGVFYLHLPWMDEEPVVGDMLEVKGSILAPGRAMNPAAWDEKDWLAKRGVHAVIKAREVEVTAEVDKAFLLERWAMEARSWVGAKITDGLDPGSEDAKVIRAMFLGERPVGAREMVEDFRRSGTIHVFAVSGLHVMMIGGFAAFMLRLFGVPRKVWVVAVIAVMFFYALVTGMRPPAMRAAVMGSIVIGAWLVSRKPVLGNSVALSALVAVLWNGHVIFMPGFQLSFGVLASIVLTAGLIHKCFGWIHYTDPFLPRQMFTRWQEVSLWLRRKLSGGFTVGGSAWMGSAPLMLWHFGIATPVSFLVSVPLVFLAFFIMALSCVSLCIGSIWSGGAVYLNKVNGLQAAGARNLAALSAQVPGSHFIHRPWQSGERVVVYSLPEGGACCYLGIGGGLLLDAGDLDSFYREVWPSLRHYGAPVDSVIATHADSRHCGGLEAVLELYQVNQALVPDEGESRGVLRKVLGQMQGGGLNLVRAREGQRLELGGDNWIEVLYAPGDTGGLADDRCMVLRLHWRGRKILFLDDAGFKFEKWALSRGVDLSADVMVLGKHGRDFSGTPALIGRVNPGLVIASEHDFPEGQSRGEEWYEMLERRSIKVYRLERDGAVTLEQDADGLRATAFREVK